jgi:hypothetical protein
MKIVIRCVMLAALVGLGVWLYTILFPGPEKAIRKRLAKVAQLASIKPDQGLISRGASIQELANCFDSKIEITLNLRGGAEHSVTGRDGIIEVAKLAHARFRMLQIDFLDMNVTLSPDKESATVHLTAKGSSSEERDFQVQEFKFTLKKINGEWLIISVETIRTLSWLQTSEVAAGRGAWRHYPTGQAVAPRAAAQHFDQPDSRSFIPPAASRTEFSRRENCHLRSLRSDLLPDEWA